MRIDSTGNNPLAAGSPQGPKSSKEEFLLLLVAQLENQNPLEPQSGAEFIAQLAQFASVEQAEATNGLLENMHAEQVSASNASMAGFVGKEGRFNVTTMQIDDVSKGVPDVSFEVETSAKKVEFVVLNEDGEEVRQLDLGTLPPGEHTASWDGKNHLGQDVPDGRYTIAVRVEDEDGAMREVSSSMAGSIESIDFSNGFGMMRIGGVLFAPGDIMSVG